MKLKKFNIGIFAFNASSGVTLTKSKKRWDPNWEKVKNIAIYADKKKFDFLLPIARWNDWKGITRPHKNTFETFSLMSSLSAVTKKINLFSTIHTAFLHPVFAARAATTISNISKGRYGVNIVCGWNESEFQMFDVKKNISSDNRYLYGEEWLKIFNKLINKKSDKISFSGKFFTVKNAQCFPKLHEGKNITKISAAFSEKGRIFASKNFDILLTMFSKIENLKKNNSNIKLNAMKKGKKIKIFSNVHIVCKKTRSEASDFYNQYSKTKQDTLAVNSFINNLEWSKKVVLASYLRQVKQKISGSLGGYTIIGTKNDVIEQLNEIYRSKCDGIALTFFDYKKDLEFFGKNILSSVKKF